VADLTALPPNLPMPEDDGACDHLIGLGMPEITLPATDGRSVSLARSEAQRTIVYAYPRTGRPGEPELTDDWDLIPGARGCTPESCGFRDHHAELREMEADVYGLSTQGTDHQRELADRLGLPFAILSDAGLELTSALRLPTLEVAGLTLLRRHTLVISDGRIEHVFYPVFPPDGHAAEVLAWLRERSAHVG
jgi:peroxiredoxin